MASVLAGSGTQCPVPGQCHTPGWHSRSQCPPVPPPWSALQVPVPHQNAENRSPAVGNLRDEDQNGPDERNQACSSLASIVTGFLLVIRADFRAMCDQKWDYALNWWHSRSQCQPFGWHSRSRCRPVPAFGWNSMSSVPASAQCHTFRPIWSAPSQCRLHCVHHGSSLSTPKRATSQRPRRYRLTRKKSGETEGHPFNLH